LPWHQTAAYLYSKIINDMEELQNINIPEGLLTPDEMARFLKFQSDAKAFYDKHGDHINWLVQAADLGLMEVEELTPDDLQYLEAASKIVDEHNLTDIEGYDEMQAARERFETLNYLKSEMNWFQNLMIRKQAEVAKRMIGHIEKMIKAAEKHRAKHPEDERVAKQIDTLKLGIEAFTTQATVADLSASVREGLADN
jgi:hypothetical protein